MTRSSSSEVSRRGFLRVQAAQPLVVEGVDDLAHGLFVSGDQASYDRDGVAAGRGQDDHRPPVADRVGAAPADDALEFLALRRSEEHTSELQPRLDLVCRLLLEKKKNTNTPLQRPSMRVHK